MQHVLLLIGKGHGPETPAAPVLWEESSLPFPLRAQREASGTTTSMHFIVGIFFCFQTLGFFHARRFWACVTSWWLIHTSCRCGIPPALAHCCTHPVLNCRGRCWLLCPHMFLWAWTVTVRVEVRSKHYFSFNTVDNTIFCVNLNCVLVFTLWKTFTGCEGETFCVGMPVWSIS